MDTMEGFAMNSECNSLWEALFACETHEGQLVRSLKWERWSRLVDNGCRSLVSCVVHSLSSTDQRRCSRCGCQIAATQLWSNWTSIDFHWTSRDWQPLSWRFRLHWLQAGNTISIWKINGSLSLSLPAVPHPPPIKNRKESRGGVYGKILHSIGMFSTQSLLGQEIKEYRTEN